MKRYAFLLIIVLVTVYGFTYNDHKMNIPNTVVTTEDVTYTSADGATLKGYIAYNPSYTKKRPAVLVVPEWWGLTEYVKSRARQLAGLGYFAMAVDMYGNGKVAADPKEATKLSGPFYKDMAFEKMRFDAALAKIKTYPDADTNEIAAIGYCFGGGIVLNVARMGERLKAVVSFHGNLIGAPPVKKLLKARVLVCQGGADKFVPMSDLMIFEKQMDSINARYAVRVYCGATHAFTNPAATALGKKFSLPIQYDAAADTASWNEMKDFFERAL